MGVLERPSIMIAEILLIGQISKQAPSNLLWRTSQIESIREREKDGRKGETFTDTGGMKRLSHVSLMN